VLAKLKANGLAALADALVSRTLIAALALAGIYMIWDARRRKGSDPMSDTPIDANASPSGTGSAGTAGQGNSANINTNTATIWRFRIEGVR